LIALVDPESGGRIPRVWTTRHDGPHGEDLPQSGEQRRDGLLVDAPYHTPFVPASTDSDSKHADDIHRRRALLLEGAVSVTPGSASNP